ncbi:MAG: hypothetical protein AAGC92_13005 [Pseudomonadota bacterium]
MSHEERRSEQRFVGLVVRAAGVAVATLFVPALLGVGGTLAASGTGAVIGAVIAPALADKLG